MTPSPPRLAAWLVRRRIGGPVAENILGDLEEQLADRVEGRRGAGAGPADYWWYWREVIRLIRPGIPRRIRPPTPRRSPDRGGVMVLLQDLRFAWRAIHGSPGFALMTVLTLGLGIAGTTTVFSAIDGFVLRPFPFPEQSRLVTVGSAHPKVGVELTFFEHLSPAEYLDLAKSRSLERVVAWDLGNRQVAFGDQSENLFTGFWWGDPLATIGLPPFLGRGFSADEIERGERVAVLSHRVWRDRFGADSSLVGGRILVNGEPYQVIGIMPRRSLVFGTDLWLPFPARPEVFPRNRRMLQVLARLTPGTSLDAAAAELEVIARQTETEHVAAMPEYAGWRLVPRTWADANFQILKPATFALGGAIAFVMLLVCTNIATLLLSRSAARAREITLRSALGASRARIFRQLVTESVVLSLAGAAVGIGLGHFGLRGVNRVLESFPVSLYESLSLNLPVLVTVTLVAIGAGLVFGTIPAAHALRSDLRDALHLTRFDGHRSRLRLQRVLIGVEAALAVTLLAASGYLIRTFAQLREVDPGFAPERVLTMRLTLARERYRPEAVEPFFQTVRERIGSLPGIRGVATANQFPPMLFGRDELRIEGAVEAEGTKPFAYRTIASPEYFGTLDIPLRRGRLISEADRPGGPMVVVVNEVVARRYFPGSDPIGRRVQLGRRGEAWAEIVGVVGATRNQGLDVEPAPELFLSSLQVPGWDNQMFLLVRTEGDPRIMANAIRSTVHSIDPDQPIYRMQTIEETYDQGQLSRRISVIGFTLFAAFALVLAAVGLYGVVSYSTAQRTREIGVRVALGGARTAVAGLFVRQAMVPVGIGVVIGLGAAWGVGRAMASLLFEVGAGDGLTLLGAAGLLVAVGLLASYLPAARASRIDPVTTLRQD